MSFIVIYTCVLYLLQIDKANLQKKKEEEKVSILGHVKRWSFFAGDMVVFWLGLHFACRCSRSLRQRHNRRDHLEAQGWRRAERNEDASETRLESQGGLVQLCGVMYYLNDVCCLTVDGIKVSLANGYLGSWLMCWSKDQINLKQDCKFYSG